jgi:hypothetical protein
MEILRQFVKYVLFRNTITIYIDRSDYEQLKKYIGQKCHYSGSYHPYITIRTDSLEINIKPMHETIS